MASYNKVIMLGNLVRDPITKGPFCKFTLATNHRYKKDGQQVDEPCFLDIDVFGKQGENCMKFLSKGKPALVEGRLVMNTWTDEKGEKKTRMSVMAESVTFVGNKSDSESEQQKSNPYNQNVLNDSLPF